MGVFTTRKVYRNAISLTVGPSTIITTFSATNFTAGITLSPDKLTASFPGTTWHTVQTLTPKTYSTSSKRYAEFKLLGAMASPANYAVGLSEFTDETLEDFPGHNGEAVCCMRANAVEDLISADFTSGAGTVPSFSAVNGSVIALTIDFGTGNLWFSHNNDFGTGNPGAGSNPHRTFTPTKTFFLVAAAHDSDVTTTLQLTASNQTYTPPSGFSAWDA